MANLTEVHPLFQGATKFQVKEALGQATESGIDKYGMDVICYELGDIPDADGGGNYHLTFVFENEVVVSVLGNFMTLSQ